MKQTPTQSSGKSYKVKSLWTRDPMFYPCGLGQTNKINATKDVELVLPSLEGWALIKYKGQLIATNGSIVAELIATPSEKTE